MMLLPPLLLVAIEEASNAIDGAACIDSAAQISPTSIISRILTYTPMIAVLITAIYLARQYATWRSSRIRLQQLHKQKLGMNNQGWVVGSAYIPKSEEKKRLERIEALEAEERQRLQRQGTIPFWNRYPRSVSSRNGEKLIARPAPTSHAEGRLQLQPSPADNSETREFNQVLSSTTLPGTPSPMNDDDDTSASKSVNRRLSFSSALRKRRKRNVEEETSSPLNNKKRNSVRFSEELHSTRYYTREGAPSNDMMFVEDDIGGEEKKEEEEHVVIPAPHNTYDAAMSESKENIASGRNNVNAPKATSDVAKKPMLPVQAFASQKKTTVGNQQSTSIVIVPTQPRFALGSYTKMPPQRHSNSRLPPSVQRAQSRTHATNGRIQLPSATRFLQGRRTGLALHDERSNLSRQQRIWEERVVLGALNATTPRKKSVTFAAAENKTPAAAMGEAGDTRKVTFAFGTAAAGEHSTAANPSSATATSAASTSSYDAASSTSAPSTKAVGFTFDANTTSNALLSAPALATKSVGFTFDASATRAAVSSNSAAPAASTKTVGFNLGANTTADASSSAATQSTKTVGFNFGAASASTTDAAVKPVAPEESVNKDVRFAFAAPAAPSTGASSTSSGAPFQLGSSSIALSESGPGTGTGAAPPMVGFSFGSAPATASSHTSSVAAKTSTATAFPAFAFGSTATTPSIPPNTPTSFGAGIAPATPGFAFGGSSSSAGFTPAAASGTMTAGAGATPGFALGEAGGGTSSKRRILRVRKR